MMFKLRGVGEEERHGIKDPGRVRVAEAVLKKEVLLSQ